jgi:hypothetical protein
VSPTAPWSGATPTIEHLDPKALNGIQKRAHIMFLPSSVPTPAPSGLIKLYYHCSHRPTRPEPTRPGKYQNRYVQQNLLCGTFSKWKTTSTFFKWKTTSTFFSNGILPQLFSNGRRPQPFFQMEDDLNFFQMEDDLKKMTSIYICL